MTMKNWTLLFFRISILFLALLVIPSGCKEDEPDKAQLPGLTTNTVLDISSTSASGGGEVTNDGGAPITARGLVWSTAGNPTLAINEGLTSDGDGVGQFTSSLTDLLPYTKYFVRAYATNSTGTSYGNQVEFETLPEGAYSTVTDIDGNTYWTTAIGELEWMAQNLRTTRYSDGTPIASGLSEEEWETTTEGAYIDPYADSAVMKYIEPALEVDIYGFLYNAYAVRSTLNKPCPEGWYVPSEEDWENMELGLKIIYNVDDDELASVIKSCRQVNSPLGGGCNTIYHPRWDEHPSVYGTNEAFFLALPAGQIKPYMQYVGHGESAWWWLAPEDPNNTSSFNPRRNIIYDRNDVFGYESTNNHAFSIRCCRPLVKDK